jgi:hypothetical protein
MHLISTALRDDGRSVRMATQRIRRGLGRGAWIFIALLVAYGVAIWYDLPPAAGTRYAQDLPASTLTKWGATPIQSGQPAAHWWVKTQGLRGWSVYPEGWFWPKLVPAPFTHWLALIGLGLLGAIGLRLLERRAPQSRGTTALVLVGLVAFGYAIELGTLWLKSPNVEQLLLERITDRDFTGYFSSASNIGDLSAFFAKYANTITSPTYCDHCKTHPPGPVFAYWLMLHAVYSLPLAWQYDLRDVLLASRYLPNPDLPPASVVVALVGAHVILLAAAAIVIPLYGLARRLAGAESALPLTALGTVLPGLILMSPEFDQIYGTLAAGLFYFGVRGLSTRHHSGWWGLGSGLLFAICLYWSFGLWVLAIPLILLAIAALAGIFSIGVSPLGTTPDQLPARAVVTWMLGLALGAVTPWALLWDLGRFNLFAVIRAVDRAHLQGITAVRPYAPWVVFNLIDYLQFVGLPLVLTTVLTLARRYGAPSTPTIDSPIDTGQSGATHIRRLVRRVGRNLNLYGILFWIVLGLLDLSGTVRAEVGRIWIFLTPLALMALYQAAGQGWLKASHVHALLAAQFVVCLLIGGCWLTP